ncbi:MAG: alanine racemase, partial [Acidobacteria bacterium]|nr:alanine racemase [Acidobacteriota bacterium]
MDKPYVDRYAWHDRYGVRQVAGVATPALMVYADEVEHNIACTLSALGGDANRWRPHVKTAKLAWTMRAMAHHGVTAVKCATTLELSVALQAGVRDAVLAYPLVGPAAQRVRQLADEFPAVHISVLAENPEQAAQWQGTPVGVFLDLNPGMDRTGLEQRRHSDILAFARALQSRGIGFRGLHYYDGHLGSLALPERRAAAHRGYDELLAIAGELKRAGIAVGEIITAGTPAFPCSAEYSGFSANGFLHRVSPGTVIYCDATSLAQLPG